MCWLPRDCFTLKSLTKNLNEHIYFGFDQNALPLGKSNRALFCSDILFSLYLTLFLLFDLFYMIGGLKRNKILNYCTCIYI